MSMNYSKTVDYPKLSMISQSTQDSASRSASLDNSDSKFNFRPSRCQESLSSVQQRLDYAKAIAIPEISPLKHGQSSSLKSHSSEKTLQKSKVSQVSQSPSVAPTLKKKKCFSFMGSVFLLACVVAGVYTYTIYKEEGFINWKGSKSLSNDKGIVAQNETPIAKYNIDRLFDPIQVKYIKSYEESAVGKYFYWDLLAEQYFNVIREQLKRIIWMEEEVIKQFLDQELDERDAPIIRKKVWKLREKSNDIDISVNFNGKSIWIYKNCVCS